MTRQQNHSTVFSSMSTSSLAQRLQYGRKKWQSLLLPNLFRTCLLPTLILCVAAGIFQEQIQNR
jgi:hypothetical protein